MQFNLAGRRALVLGGNKGIGYGIARGFAEAGAEVFLTSRSVADAQKAAATLGPLAQGVACDTGSLDSVDAACAAAGVVDILVLNHGLNVHGDRSAAAVKRSLEVNALSAWPRLPLAPVTATVRPCRG